MSNSFYLQALILLNCKKRRAVLMGNIPEAPHYKPSPKRLHSRSVRVQRRILRPREHGNAVSLSTTLTTQTLHVSRHEAYTFRNQFRL